MHLRYSLLLSTFISDVKYSCLNVYVGSCRSEASLTGNMLVVNIFYEGWMQCHWAYDSTVGGAAQGPLISKLKSLDIRPENSSAEGI